MKKITLFVAVLIGMGIIMGVNPCITFATPWAVDNPVTISLSNWVSSGFGGYGGLFTVTDINNKVSINTFCLELDEFVSLGTTYYVADVSDDVAIAGGRNTNTGDQLSNATKWLYVQYLSGVYTNAEAMQLAIWVLEGEYFDKTIDDTFWGNWNTIGGIAKSYYGAAQGQSTSADIRVLDLRNSNDQPVQSYLIMVPEPTTLIMLGIGILAFGIAARKFSRKPL